MALQNDFSISTLVAGFITVLVGFTSSGVLVFQAAQSLGASPAEIASWIWALGLAMGITTIGLSLYYRTPIVIAWSTAGAALLISSQGISLPEAIGGFVISGGLIALLGFSGLFARSMRHIPLSIAAAMLAGILLKFGIDLFVVMQQQFVMVFGMFVVYLVMRRVSPRYAVLATLGFGLLDAAYTHSLNLPSLSLNLTQPVWTTPVFNLHALSIALPLMIVTMASQNIPGIAVLRASGYAVRVSPVVGWTGVANAVFAPFGAYTVNLAAITAAICTGREAHLDPSKRYSAALAAGVFYCLIGLFGATITVLFLAFPHALIMALAGIALLGTIGNGLVTALSNESEREAALITFLVTASGISLCGLGAAFWGLVAGGLALFISRVRIQRRLAVWRQT